jgi:hypothetical protein
MSANPIPPTTTVDPRIGAGSASVSGIPASAGGDLTGTYPNPTLTAILSAGGPTGSSTVVPVITWDAKGRLTAVTTASIGSVDDALLAMGYYD